MSAEDEGLRAAGRAFLLALTFLFGLSTFPLSRAFALADETRPPALAGSWYPAEPEALRRTVEDLFARAKAPDLYGELRALIVPHAGYQYSGPGAATGYKSIGGQEIRRVIILAPTHYVHVRGCSVPSFSAYSTPLGEVPLDSEACAQLRRHPLVSDIRAAHAREHSIEIQLPLLQSALGQFSLVPVLVGDLDEAGVKELAAAIRPLLDEGTLLIASSDFTHYGPRFGFQPFKDNVEKNLRELDFGAFQAILEGDCAEFIDYKRRTGITACGALPIAILLEAVGRDTQSMLLSYYNSAQVTGDWENTVSYGTFCFTSKRALLNEAEQQTMLRLSRDVLSSFTADGTVPQLTFESYNITPALMRHAGVFVTLEKGGQLRGCIGTISGATSIATAVVQNTQSAATRDPRFPPVTAGEAASLGIELSVLTPLLPVTDPEQIRVGTDGLVLQKGKNSGILLPQVATEQGWDLEQFLQHLCLKAGLPPGSYDSSGARLYRFQVQKFSEEKKP